jgi:hypothetical protein
MWTTLGYLLRISLALLKVLIVLYVFSRLNVRFEIIVVAILGLIYVAVLHVGAGLELILAKFLVGWEKDFIFIRKHIGDDIREREMEFRGIEKKLKGWFAPWMIEGVTNLAITGICLFELFTTL